MKNSHWSPKGDKGNVLENKTSIFSPLFNFFLRRKKNPEFDSPESNFLLVHSRRETSPKKMNSTQDFETEEKKHPLAEIFMAQTQLAFEKSPELKELLNWRIGDRVSDIEEDNDKEIPQKEPIKAKTKSNRVNNLLEQADELASVFSENEVLVFE